MGGSRGGGDLRANPANFMGGKEDAKKKKKGGGRKHGARDWGDSDDDDDDDDDGDDNDDDDDDEDDEDGGSEEDESSAKSSKKSKSSKKGGAKKASSKSSSGSGSDSDEELNAVRRLIGDKVAPSNSSSSSSSSSAADNASSSSSGVYSAPRLTSVEYDGDKKNAKDERRRKRDVERLGKSEVLQNLRREFSDRPEEEGIDGITDGGTGGARKTAIEKMRENEAEKKKYEEDRFIRFVEGREEKKIKKKLEREEMSINARTDFGSFADGVDTFEKIERRDKRRGGKEEGKPEEKGRHANGKRIRTDITADSSSHGQRQKKGGFGTKNELQREMFGNGDGGGGKKKKKSSSKR